MAITVGARSGDGTFPPRADSTGRVHDVGRSPTMRAQHLATGLTPILKQKRTTKAPLKLPTLPIPLSRTLGTSSTM